MVSEMPRSQSSTMVSAGSGPAAVDSLDVVGGQAGPARAADRRELAQLVAGLGVGQLEEGPADPGDARSGPPGRRCAWSAPTARRARPAGGRPGAGSPGRTTRRCAGPGPRCAASSSMASSRSPDERRAPFEAEGDHGHPPAVVLVADPVGHRHPDLVEEELGELGGPGDGGERADLDPGGVHGQDRARRCPGGGCPRHRCAPAARSSRPPRRGTSRSSTR